MQTKGSGVIVLILTTSSNTMAFTQLCLFLFGWLVSQRPRQLLGYITDAGRAPRQSV